MAPIIISAAPQPTRLERMAAPTTAFAGLSLVTLALHLRDPHQQNSWGFCPSALVGVWCPGCGGLRAVNDLTNLQLADAASSNLAFVIALPFIAFLLVRWTVGRWRGTYRPVMAGFTPRGRLVLMSLGFTVLGAFTALRNLPAGAWLAP
ncbi:MAG: DUF2752 domain-containing protein [Nocardioides sp.]